MMEWFNPTFQEVREKQFLWNMHNMLAACHGKGRRSTYHIQPYLCHAFNFTLTPRAILVME
jgi:hypothetical protein